MEGGRGGSSFNHMPSAVPLGKVFHHLGNALDAGTGGKVSCKPSILLL